MVVDVIDLSKIILDRAATIGGETWLKIKQSAPLYVKSYVQSLADIADGVIDGQISKQDAKMYVKNSNLLLVMGIANTSHIILVQVQKFVDAVIASVKDTINAALPVAIV